MSISAKNFSRAVLRVRNQWLWDEYVGGLMRSMNRESTKLPALRNATFYAFCLRSGRSRYSRSHQSEGPARATLDLTCGLWCRITVTFNPVTITRPVLLSPHAQTHGRDPTVSPSPGNRCTYNERIIGLQSYLGGIESFVTSVFTRRVE